MRHLTAAETQGDFHLVAVLEKLEHVAHLDVIVMRVGVRAELDLFDLDDLLLLAGLGFALLLFVFELAEVHDLAHGRRRVGRDFHQVQTGFIRQIHGFTRVYNTQVFAFGTDESDFWRPDTVVYTGAGVALRRRIMRSAGYGLFPSEISGCAKNRRGRPVFQADSLCSSRSAALNLSRGLNAKLFPLIAQ